MSVKNKDKWHEFVNKESRESAKKYTSKQKEVIKKDGTDPNAHPFYACCSICEGWRAVKYLLTDDEDYTCSMYKKNVYPTKSCIDVKGRWIDVIVVPDTIPPHPPRKKHVKPEFLLKLGIEVVVEDS